MQEDTGNIEVPAVEQPVEETAVPVEEGTPVGPATIVEDEPMIEQFPTHEETV